MEPTDLVDHVMREWPATIRVFLRYRMHCIGCPIGCFHTVADACREHRVECGTFLAELRSAIEAASRQTGRDV
jgi:hybrid cluster-associated redox disulfide protein